VVNIWNAAQGSNPQANADPAAMNGPLMASQISTDLLSQALKRMQRRRIIHNSDKLRRFFSTSRDLFFLLDVNFFASSLARSLAKSAMAWT
jgi:hypothetical protein